VVACIIKLVVVVVVDGDAHAKYIIGAIRNPCHKAVAELFPDLGSCGCGLTWQKDKNKETKIRMRSMPLDKNEKRKIFFWP
jgi:hypothetical protein